jgi:hypothetical protein
MISHIVSMISLIEENREMFARGGGEDGREKEKY